MNVEAGNLRLKLELFLMVICWAVFLAEESELAIAPLWSGDPVVIVVRDIPGVVVWKSEDGLIVLTIVVSIVVDISVIGKYVVAYGFSSSKTSVGGCVEIISLTFCFLFSGDSSLLAVSVSEIYIFLRFLMKD